jgi:hypothetical protein
MACVTEEKNNETSPAKLWNSTTSDYSKHYPNRTHTGKLQRKIEGKIAKRRGPLEMHLQCSAASQNSRGRESAIGCGKAW